MDREYRTIVDGSTMPNLEWGAENDGVPVVFASGTITIYDDAGNVVINGDTATLADGGTTLTWAPAGLPVITETKLYRVRWRGVTAGGAVWLSRALIDWLREPNTGT